MRNDRFLRRSRHCRRRQTRPPDVLLPHRRGYESFEPAPAGFDRIEDAFTRAYLTTTDEYDLPERVAAAIDDAAAWIKEAFGDRPDADLRTEVLPSFYQQASPFHCRYR
ncbi:hypothetical protein [Halalkalirubrum salinum]|uniref:hypothetical protein n=1 Tax=Halalkalirubrum salinum TaxID=2563889 RepID=UPI00197AEE35|nr:hypothetical protein [Halalkalirubrum salinum]